MAPPSSQVLTVDDLEDNILIYEQMLEADPDESSNADRQNRLFITNMVKDMKRQLQGMQAQPESSGSTSISTPQVKREQDPRPPGSNSSASSHHSAWSNLEEIGKSEPSSQHLCLPSRKRTREHLESDYPEAKSLRQTPSPAYTGAPSPATTDSSSLDFDDPVMRALLGDDWSRDSHEEDQQYLRSLEEKKRQEAEDWEYAQLLQQTSEPIGSFAFSQKRAIEPNKSKQALLNPNGGLYRPMAPPPLPQRTLKADPEAQRYPSNQRVFPNSPLSLDSGSDSDLEEISATDFVPNPREPSFRITGVNPAAYSPTQFTPNMPGTYPGTTLYDSYAGASVYGAGASGLVNLPIGSTHEDLFGDYESSTSLPAGILGSSSMPFDLDAYVGSTPRMPNYHIPPEKSEEELKALLQNLRPDEQLNPDQRMETPFQMNIELMPHQKLGLQWLCKQEDSSNAGGLMCDDMGLGKTIQALALILKRRPPVEAHLPTLIVAPVSLLIQWEREAKNRIKDRHQLRIFTLHGNSRHTPWRVLKDYDLVLTTYGSLASELKRKILWDDKLKRLGSDLIPTNKEQCPTLGPRSRFHRVILDEAQNIKNKTAKSALAACYIQARYRWCLTGTPIQNRIDELYSLIKFCRIKPYNDWQRFSREFSKPLNSKVGDFRSKAMRQLQVLLRAILLRRSKTSQIDGKPILQLLPKTVEEARAVFSKDERDFYKALELQTQIQFNKYLKAGTVGRNYSNVLVLLLRLRQACCHPHLIKDIEMSTGGLEGIDLLANARELPRDVVARLREADAFECPICMDASMNPVIFGQCGHTLCEECLAKMVDHAESNDGGERVACPHCRAPIKTEKATDWQSFLRVFCPEKAAMEGLEPLENEADDDVTDIDSSDSDEDEESDNGEDLKGFIVPDDADPDFDSEDREDEKYQPGNTPFEKSKKSIIVGKRKKRTKTSKGKGKGKGKKKEKHASKSLAQLRKEGLRSKSAKRAYLRRLEENYQTSAKIDKTLALLEEINSRKQGEKTIIFSGFTSFLDLLEVPISRHPELGQYVRYDGSMTSGDRNTAVLEFSDNPRCRICLISLKAGNAGLNLTAANNVIILDPHWNPAVEWQATDRAHRIGQMRPVNVHRVLIDQEGLEMSQTGEYTVEDRILKLQARKQELVESALDENAGSSVARLGVRELGFLFGVNSM